MTAPKYRRYPVAPLVNVVAGLTIREAETRFGVHHTTIQRWRSKPDTLIIEWEADKYAVKVGMHPSELWDDWFNIEAPPRRVRGRRQLA
jgi:hypothetical protein